MSVAARCALISFVAIFTSAIMSVEDGKGDIEDIGFFVPRFHRISRYVCGYHAEFCDVFNCVGENISVGGNSPYIKVLFAFLYSKQIIPEKIPWARFNYSFGGDRCRSTFIRAADELVISPHRFIEKLIVSVDFQFSRRGIAAISPTRPKSPDNKIVAFPSVGYPTTATKMNISSVAGDHRELGSINAVPRGHGPIFRGIGRYLGVGQAFANEQQLPDEQSSLQNGDAKKHQSGRRQPPRIVSDPLRFKGQIGIGFRFFFSVALLFLDLALGPLSGQYFYGQRYLIGATSIGCSWLCGLIAWGLTAGG